MIIAQAGCGASLGNSVTILVTAPNNCFSQSYMTDANGLLTIHGLPARNYSVQVTDVDPFDTTNYSNIIMQIANKPVIIDLTVRDTAQFVTETETEIITPASIDTLPNNVIIVTPADTVLTTLVDTTYGAIPPQVSFIYRSPLDIHIDFEDAGADVVEGCPNSAGDDIILMEQGIGYDLQIEVKETFGED